jgi:hypothetical protein
MATKQEIDIRAEVRAHIARKYKTQSAAAKAWGYSNAYVSAVLCGKKMMPDVMANEAGYELVQAAAEWHKIKKVTK